VKGASVCRSRRSILPTWPAFEKAEASLRRLGFSRRRVEQGKKIREVLLGSQGHVAPCGRQAAHQQGDEDPEPGCSVLPESRISCSYCGEPSERSGNRQEHDQKTHDDPETHPDR
jgi:hypothetical protein